MDLFEYADELRYGELHFDIDPDLGYHAIVAIHNTQRGPAIGGCRFIEYDSTEDAIRDVMRLARGMTYKAAITELDHGGGKAVIVRPPELTGSRRRAIFESFGDFLETLDGRYVTCEDSGTLVSDMNTIYGRTEHVLGHDMDESGAGDPSPVTAFGIRRGIEAAVAHRYGRDSLQGLHVAIQGVGSVGYHLAEELHERGASLTVADVDPSAVNLCVEQFEADVVDPEAIVDVDCDIFAPCALGSILNDETIPRLRCDIVAGAANNQLDDPSVHARQLDERGILYAPDYAINAGGLINVAEEYRGYDRDRALEKAGDIYETMRSIFDRAEVEDALTLEVADTLAEERLDV